MNNQNIQVGDIIIERHLSPQENYEKIQTLYPDNPSVVKDRAWRYALDELFAKLGHNIFMVANRFRMIGFKSSNAFFKAWDSNPKPLNVSDPDFIRAIGQLSGYQMIYSDYQDYYDATEEVKKMAIDLERNEVLSNYKDIKKILDHNIYMATIEEALYEQGFRFLEVAVIEEATTDFQVNEVNVIQNFMYSPIGDISPIQNMESTSDFVTQIQERTGLTTNQSRLVYDALRMEARG
jgi:hypothetical protein